MRSRRLVIAAIAAVAVILIAGILLEPRLSTQTPPTTSNPNTPSNPGSNNTGSNPPPSGNDTNPSPGPGATDSAPAWKAGDWWKYNVTLADSTMDGSGLLTGWVLKAVQGTESTSEGTAYNVTITAAYELGDRLSTLEQERFSFQTANVSGYVLYRTSDLARVADAFTVWLNGSYTFENVTVVVGYEARIAASFTPPLTVWTFPLAENETWNATSNVSVRIWSAFSVTYGNETRSVNRTANATVLVDLVMHSGFRENVSVPAGEYSAIPVEAVPADLPDLSDALAGDVLNMTLSLGEMPVHPSLSLWFAPAVGNVAKAVAWLGPREDCRFEAALISFKYG